MSLHREIHNFNGGLSHEQSIAITPDGRYAYTVNTANAVISGYQVDSNGELSL